MYNKIRGLVEEGKNLFITGGGGVGKSYTLDRLVDDFPCIDITATTGIAAVNVSGQTIHKWASVGTFKLPYGIAAKNTLKDFDKYDIIQQCKILAIDEISMLSAAQLDYLDKYFRKVRGNNKIFGGIQLLLFGDLFQLPPVKLDSTEEFAGEKTLIKYCFNADVWLKLKLVPILLKQIFRQEDKQFATLLNNIREGKNVDLSLIQERELDPPDNITRLFSTNDEVKRYNNLKYNEIDEEEQIYWASDIYYKGSKGVKAWGEESNLTPNQKNLLRDFDKNCKALRCLKLKVGTRVMLLQNIDVAGGLCNGSCGYVSALHEKSVEVKFDNGTIKELKRSPFHLHFKGKKVIERKQIPLMYAYGITIHKSQGLTMDNLYIDMKRIFSPGQCYVALSRVKSLDGLYIKNFNKNKIMVDDRIVKFYKSLEKV